MEPLFNSDISFASVSQIDYSDMSRRRGFAEIINPPATMDAPAAVLVTASQETMEVEEPQASTSKRSVEELDSGESYRVRFEP
jgi:hypothetical protein